MFKVCMACGCSAEHKSWKANTCNKCLKAGFKWCSGCCAVKPISAFHKNGKTIRSMCKPCECRSSLEKKAASQYYARPDVRVRRNESSRKCKRAKYASDEQYRHAELVRCHDRRNSSIGDLTSAQWRNACSAFALSCAYCGSARHLTMEHVVPVAAGGCTTASNIIPACQHCNSSKQDKEMIAWYTSQPFYSKERLERILRYLESMKGDDA